MEISERLRSALYRIESGLAPMQGDSIVVAQAYRQLEADLEDAKMLTLHHAAHIIGLEAEIKREGRVQAEMVEAILEAQWNAEGGHWEESACPFCGASPYLGCEEKSIECHSEGCIVRKAHLREN